MKLIDYLTDSGLKPAQFAARTGIHPVSISRYLSGQRFPRPEHLSTIREATNGAVTANDFVPPAVAQPVPAPMAAAQ